MPAGWTLHKLRHRFATRAYRGTRNLRAVQTLLGHASVATTERYTAVDDAEVRAAALAASQPSATGRIAGAIGAVTAAAMLVVAGVSTQDAATALIGAVFTPKETHFLAVLTSQPDFDYRDRTQTELVSYAHTACRAHDMSADAGDYLGDGTGIGAGDSAALHWLTTNHRIVDDSSRVWNAVAASICHRTAAKLHTRQQRLHARASGATVHHRSY